MLRPEERPRNLNYSQTLDELLGISFGKPGQDAAAVPPIPPPDRPTTRHGRRTSDVVHDLPVVVDATDTNKSTEVWQRESDEESKASDDEDSSSDEFIKKLRNVRRNPMQNEAKENGENVITIEVKRGALDANSVTTAPAPTAVKDDQTGNQTSSSSSTSSFGSRSSSGKENGKPSQPTIRSRSSSKGSINRKSSTAASDATVSRTSANPAQKTAKKVIKFREDKKKTASNARNLESESSALRSSNDKSAHQAWLTEKNIQEAERRRQQKEKEKEDEKTKEKRKDEAQKSFECWKQRADQEAIARRRRQRENAKAKQKREEEERERKTVESKKMFDAWRRDRQQQVSDLRKKEKESEESDKKRLEEENATKTEEAQKVFLAWCEKKKAERADLLRKTMESRRASETLSRTEKEYKDALAKEAYDLWIQMKDKERSHSESLRERILRFSEEANKRWPPPWIPPSNTVPRKFTPSGRRRHSAKRFNSASNPRSRSAH